MVCASNMNRSMEAHALLQKRGFNVWSYGTGTNVKLPGPTADQPNVYEFATPYRQIYEQLRAQDEDLYSGNAVLRMLERNMAVKVAPERWQERAEPRKHFDVVLAFEERVFEAVLEDLQARDAVELTPVHVMNLEVRDTHADAAESGPLVLQLCEALESGFGEEAGEEATHPVQRVMETFEERTGKRILYSPQLV
ncbi:hypothetical protein CDCA_CDCA04G1376 [Cyanidium caldarium]|uniref:RNA polymerase II subunit A C-terminal domain phosphatase SSU72 n=1 Tax=Cyanidium caldarium TaxID=2771 RepID=A0AAV9ITD3_CYACA|nr:hypothetical protein CDCA_CDCA04G1376 [Cyanidium caldarium]